MADPLVQTSAGFPLPHRLPLERLISRARRVPTPPSAASSAASFASTVSHPISESAAQVTQRLVGWPMTSSPGIFVPSKATNMTTIRPTSTVFRRRHPRTEPFNTSLCRTKETGRSSPAQVDPVRGRRPEPDVGRPTMLNPPRRCIVAATSSTASRRQSPATPPGSSPDAPPAPTTDNPRRTSTDPVARRARQGTTPDDPAATTPEHPAASRTADHDPPDETEDPSPHSFRSSARNRGPNATASICRSAAP